MGNDGFSDWRVWVTGRAQGRVLEIGAGDGVNFDFYDEDAFVVAIEPDPLSIELMGDHASNIRIVQASAEDLPFSDDSFDAVVGSLVFCTIPDAHRAIHQVRRVLRPGGSLRLVEHVRAKNQLLALAMHLATPLWKRVTGGCHLDRDTLRVVEQAGFHVVALYKRWFGLLIGIDAVKASDSAS